MSQSRNYHLYIFFCIRQYSINTHKIRSSDYVLLCIRGVKSAVPERGGIKVISGSYGLSIRDRG